MCRGLPDDQPVGLRRALANLLRLADADLRDAQCLVRDGTAANAAWLVHRAILRMGAAVAASGAGRYEEGLVTDLAGLPDEGPGHDTLRALAADSQPQPRLGEDGSLRRGPQPGAVSKLVMKARTALTALCQAFAVEVEGSRPAGRARPPEPVPVAPPRKPSPGDTAPGAGSGRARAAVRSRPAPRLDLVGGSEAPPRAPRRTPPRTSPKVGRTPPGLTSNTFWKLVDAWKIDDRQALRMLGHDGGLTARGTRPRFKLSGLEAEMLQGLAGIDATLTSLGKAPARWLVTPIRSAPLNGAQPLDWIIRRRLVGLRELSQHLLQAALKASVDGGPPAAPKGRTS